MHEHFYYMYLCINKFHHVPIPVQFASQGESGDKRQKTGGGGSSSADALAIEDDDGFIMLD